MSANPDFDDPITLWPTPDLGVLRTNRREPPSFPIEVFGDFWAEWVTVAAAGASAPVDYTGCTLLAVAATLIGHARWVSPWDGWSEPPTLWIGNIGDPSSSKSPAADPLIRILRDIEIELARDYPGALQQWEAERASASAHRAIWESEVKDAAKGKRPAPPMPSAANAPDEPARPRVVSSDATVEKLAELAAAHPKGLMLVRDELSGWYGSLGRYSKSGADRAFWIEAYGGRPFAIDRINTGRPITVDRLGVGLFGGIQPERLCEMMQSPDDGLLSRFLWSWPNKVQARRPSKTADIPRASTALRKLYDLPLVTGDGGNLRPFFCRMTDEAADTFTSWWTKHQAMEMVGPLAGPLGKAPGHVARLSIAIEHLWWSGNRDWAMPPSTISDDAVSAALALIVDYFHPMNERAYGDAGLPEADRLAAVLAKWIIKTRPELINSKKLRRSAGLPGLREAEKVKLAIQALIEADWLLPAPFRAGSSGGRPRDNYIVNPRLKTVPNA